MDCRADLGVRRDHAVLVVSQLGDPRRPPQCVPVTEPQLRSGQRQRALLRQPAGQVARVEERDPQARLGRRLEQGAAHGVPVRVRVPARLVMQVVELAHAAHPGQRHLGVDRPGQPEVAVRVEPGRDGVHALAPGPERAAVRLGGGPQRPVKGVRVSVGEAGQGEAAEAFEG